MFKFATKIKAIDPCDGVLKQWDGPVICAPSWKLAEEYCRLNGLGYCDIYGIIQEIIPCKPDTYEPDWDRRIIYTNNN